MKFNQRSSSNHENIDGVLTLISSLDSIRLCVFYQWMLIVLLWQLRHSTLRRIKAWYKLFSTTNNILLRE